MEICDRVILTSVSFLVTLVYCLSKAKSDGNFQYHNQYQKSYNQDDNDAVDERTNAIYYNYRSFREGDINRHSVSMGGGSPSQKSSIESDIDDSEIQQLQVLSRRKRNPSRNRNKRRRNSNKNRNRSTRRSPIADGSTTTPSTTTSSNDSAEIGNLTSCRPCEWRHNRRQARIDSIKNYIVRKLQISEPRRNFVRPPWNISLIHNFPGNNYSGVPSDGPHREEDAPGSVTTIYTFAERCKISHLFIYLSTTIF